MVLRFLSDEYYAATTWHDLGLQLGLYEPRLKVIERNMKGTEECLRECLSAWLNQMDGVKEKGSPNWLSLAQALEAIQQNSIATIAYFKSNCNLN